MIIIFIITIIIIIIIIMVSNVKVVVGEECATQHRQGLHSGSPQKVCPRTKVWKLKDFGNQVEFCNFFNALIQGNETGKTLDERWKYLKNNLINAKKQVCGVSTKHTWKRQTWWWNDKVQQAVSHKRKCFKVWKAGGDRDAYQATKRASNLAVYIAKTDAEKIAFKEINPRSVEIYRLAKQMRRENQDVIGDKPVRNNNGQMSLDVDSKKEAWREHYMHLLNVEFSWNLGCLPEVYPVEGTSEPTTTAMVRKAINMMSLEKAAGPSGIVAEMLKAAGSSGASMIRDLIENIFENRIPSEWQESHIVSVYKGKGDALNRSNYRGLKLIDQVMKVLERVVEGFIRQRVVINDMQCGFMQDRVTTDAIFILRQLQEKHLVAGKPLYLAFIDLEKAFDRVPREVIWWSMRKLKIDEWFENCTINVQRSEK